MEFDLQPLTARETRVLGFATEYAALCQKYDVRIEACGCCNSPFLVVGESIFVDGIDEENIVHKVRDVIDHKKGISI